MFSHPSVRYGLLGGAVVVFYFLLLYFINPSYFLSPLLQWGSLGFYLLFMWQAARMDAAQKGGGRDFREVLRTPFIVFLLINLCYWLFFYALHLFDPGMGQMEMSLEMAHLKEQIASGTGDPQLANALRERMAELEKTMQMPVSQPLGPIITRMCVGALGGFALAAAVAAIIRSKD